MRRTRKVILNEGQSIEDLDLWPGDEVWLHSSWGLIGTVDASGALVTHAER